MPVPGFTAHNIALPGGRMTFPGAPVTADSGICRAALRDINLAIPDMTRRWVTVADLGCLEGGYTAAFARAGYRATGYEVNPENFACCEYVREQLNLPGLEFARADVRETVAAAGKGEWDAVFCCGLLYHLENPVRFLHQLGRATRKLLMVQAHYSTRPDCVHEGRHGHWYDEGATRWSSWGNSRSFWLTKGDLMDVLRESGFDLVFEQADYLDDIPAGGITEPDARSMFAAFKTGD